MEAKEFADNPLLDPDPFSWERLIEAADPAAMVVRIASRMGPALKSRTSAEDLWQETLLHAWRDRCRHRWSGLRSFRRWLIEIAENRIRDCADRHSAAKRAASGETPQRPADSEGSFVLAASSSTPSQHLLHRERAEVLASALESLPDDVREIVRRRMFEEETVEEIATATQLTPAAVKHRLHKGAALFRGRLERALGTQTGGFGRK